MREKFAATHKMMTSTLEKVEAQHQATLSARQREYAEKNGATAEAHATQIAETEVSWQARFDELEAQMMAVRAQSDTSTDAHRLAQAEVDRANRAREESQKALAASQTELQATAAAAQSAAERLKASTAELEASRVLVVRLEADLFAEKAAADDSASGLSNELLEARATIDGLQASAEQSSADIGLRDSSIASLKAEIKMLQEVRDQMADGLENTSTRLQLQLGEARNAIRELETEKVAATTSHRALLDPLRAELEASQQTCAVAEAAAAASTARIAECEATAQSQAAALAALREELVAAAKAHQAELVDTGKRHGVQLQQIREEWDRDRAVMVAQHNKELENLRLSMSSKEGEAEHTSAALSALRAELAQATAEREHAQSQVGQLTTDVGNAEAEKELFDAKVKAGGARFAVLEASVAELERERDAKAATIKGLQQRDADRELQLSQSARDKTVAGAKAAAEAEAALKQLRDKHANAMAMLLEENRRSAASSKKSFDAEREKLMQVSAQLRGEVMSTAQGKGLAVQLQQNAEAKLATLLRDHEMASQTENAIAKDLEIQKKVLADALAIHTEELAALRAEHEQEIESRRKGEQVSSASRVAELEKTHGMQLRKAQLDAEQTMELYRKVQEKQRAELRAKLNSELSDQLQEKLDALRATLKAEHGAQLAAAGQWFKSTEAMLECRVADAVRDAESTTKALVNTQARESKLCSKIAENASSMGKMRTDIQSRDQTIAKLQRDQASETASMRAELEKAHARVLADLEERFRAAIQELEMRLEELARRSTEKAKIFEDELRASEARFAGRPSKQSDLDRIRSLEEQLDLVTKRMSVLEAQNRQYHAEVRHQDQAMHMVFKNNPNVGNMNPLGVTSSPAKRTKVRKYGGARS